jgi:hypothetical protein
MVDLSLAGPEATLPRFGGRKSDAELARMTPEQHVREYCDEYYHHAFWDHEYTNLLESYVLRDGIEAIPALITAVDQFDPAVVKEAPAGRTPGASRRWGCCPSLMKDVYDCRRSMAEKRPSPRSSV